jgi:hypothetical protein
MHRLIMNSGAYQQRSDTTAEAQAADPENLLLGRQNRRRLDFEALRDALLAVSGRLDPASGGRPVPLADSPRRTVYAFIDRQNLDGVLRTFDFASPDTSSPRRHSTIVPQQALFLMNSPFAAEQARAPGPAGPRSRRSRPRGADRRPLSAASSPARPRPTRPERGSSSSPRTSRAEPGSSRAWEAYAQVLLLTNEFLFVD